MSELTKFDDWLKDGGPAALVIRELLEPVEGPDGVLFPATFAAAEDKRQFAGGYNIDSFSDGSNVCLVDSVGSQANRIEPMFAKPAYLALVPQILVTFPEKKPINLLKAGHRAGDALIRFTKAGETIWEAFQALKDDRNAEPLAKIAPTSLVFGVWDSRGTQEKVPRAFRSVIRAFNVRKLSRSAQFNRAVKFVEEGYIKEELDVGEGEKNALSREGFKDSPATASHGGVQVNGEIRRETTINLSAIRRLCAGGAADTDDDDSEDNLKLRRYILGLVLVAATATFDELFDLREGCQLRQKPGHQPKWRAVPYRGEDKPLPDLTDTAALQFARAAGSAFGVGASGEYPFDKATAEKWLALKKEEQEKRRRTGPMTKQFDDASEQTALETTESAPAQPRRGRRSQSRGEGT